MNALLYASITGAILIVVIGLLRLLFARQVSRRVFLVLWLLAVVRLLLPVSLPSPTSIYNLPLFSRDRVISVPAQELPDQTVTASLPEQQSPVTEQSEEPVVLPPVQEETGLSLMQLLTVIWASVGLCLFLGMELRHLFSRRRYRFSLPLPEGEGISVPEGLQVRMLDGLSTPLTYGVFRPTVLIPVRCLEQPEQLQHILLHEQAHIRNWDLLKKHLFLLTACIHWFNPLVWLMVALAFEDMEIRCDAVAVHKLGTQQKKAYARTLVSAETARLNDLLLSNFSQSTTARRLKALIHLRRRPVISAVVCVCLVLALTLGFLTGPVALSAPAEETPASETTLQDAVTVSIPEPSASDMRDLSYLPQTEPLYTKPTEPSSSETIAPVEKHTEPPATESTTEEGLPAEADDSGQAYDGAWPDPQEVIWQTVIQNSTDVRINAKADSEIQVLDSTKAWMFVTHSGSFYTDRPDVVSVEGEDHAIEWWNYNWGYFGFYEASVTVTGVSPGTATVFFRANGKEFRLFTVTVVERQVLVAPTEGAVPLDPEE